MGETVRDYAKVILKHASLISSMATHHNGKKFTLATYPSNMITNLLVDFYRHWGNGYIVEHQEGSVEEVSNWVASGQTEIGIVYTKLLVEKRADVMRRYTAVLNSCIGYSSFSSKR